MISKYEMLQEEMHETEREFVDQLREMGKKIRATEDPGMKVLSHGH